MKILGLDFETTGLEATSERVIEIGAVAWDTNTKGPLAILSEVLNPEDLNEMPEASEKIHGISMDVLRTFGTSSKDGFLRLTQWMAECDYVVAHNAPFERAFLTAELSRHQIGFSVDSLPWIDTMTDIPYSDQIQTRKLTYIAAEHGILNPRSHRAVTDVMVMLEVLNQYPISAVVERAKSPLVRVLAKVSFDEKDKAKERGFRWNPADKVWFKDLKEMDLLGADFPFAYDTVDA